MKIFSLFFELFILQFKKIVSLFESGKAIMLLFLVTLLNALPHCIEQKDE